MRVRLIVFVTETQFALAALKCGFDIAWKCPAAPLPYGLLFPVIQYRHGNVWGKLAVMVF